MKTIHYRIAHKQDLHEMVRLINQLGYQSDAGELLTTLEEIRARQGEVFVAEENGNIVGCINTIIDVRLAEGRTGEIVSLVVDEGFRGGGIGKGLVKHAEQWLHTRTDKIRVRANALRKDSHRFYAELGYHEIKQQKVFTRNPES